MKRPGFFVLLLGLSMAASAAVASPPRSEWHFTALLDGKPIGYHRFALTDAGDGLELRSEAQFDVKFLLFVAYRYAHESRERWQGNCLQSISSRTDDNGKRFSVRGVETDGQFLLRDGQRQESLPACVMTFAYWNPAILHQTRLLNSQNGDYLEVRVTPVGRETILVRGTEVPAQRYALRGKGIAIDLWYSLTQDWLALESVTDGGRHLRYEIR
jgi:predicted GNAT family acetyltransferase